MRLFCFSLLLIFTFGCSKSKTNHSNLLDFVPKNTTLIIKTSNLESLNNSISNSDFLQRISNTTTYKNLENKLKQLSPNDYKSMKLPSKRHRVNYPKKMHLLPNLLPELNELNDMIGLQKFKKQIVDQIIFFIQSTHDNIMLHTVLEGPPGTGKTTVSNVLARIYSKLGIFKRPKFNIVRRSDLISEYLGGTSIKTMETLERCKRGVMLIGKLCIKIKYNILKYPNIRIDAANNLFIHCSW